MFFHYVKVGFRNILKYKLFSFINVFGLATAISICMLVMLMLSDQKSHDQFNVKKDRFHRMEANELQMNCLKNIIGSMSFLEMVI